MDFDLIDRVQEDNWVFFVGPWKTGTSWIDNVIRSNHSSLVPNAIKETRFFDRYFDKGLSWYLSHFDSEVKTHVEVAPSYFCNLESIHRISSIFPSAAIVVGYRDPIERYYSFINHLWSYGHISDFALSTLRARKDAIESSCYAKYIREWSSCFSNVFVYDFDMINVEPQLLIQSIRRILADCDNHNQWDLPLDVVNRASSGPRKFTRQLRVIADMLRAYKLYSLIEFAKRVGLKNLYSRQGVSSGQSIHDWRPEILSFAKSELGREALVEFKDVISLPGVNVLE